MASTYTKLIYHVIFSTKDCETFITYHAPRARQALPVYRWNRPRAGPRDGPGADAARLRPVAASRLAWRGVRAA